MLAVFISCGHLQGPEIRTGFLKNPDQPVKLTPGREITITTDYSYKGDEDTIAMRQDSMCTRSCIYHYRVCWVAIALDSTFTLVYNVCNARFAIALDSTFTLVYNVCNTLSMLMSYSQ